MKITKKMEWLLGLATLLLTGLVSIGYSYAENQTAAPCPVVVVDAGHGGKDPGKIGTDGTEEKEINLQIALRLRDCLEAEGFKVVMTRTDDTPLYDDAASNKQRDDLKNRCALIESVHAAFSISIHQNSYSDPDVHGAQVFYYQGSEAGQTMAAAIQSGIRQMADPGNTRIHKANSSYYMLKNAKCPSVIVECGFLSNPEETKKLRTRAYQQQMAEAICAGFVNYYHAADEVDA